DEDLLAALLLPPRGRDEIGRAPLDLARERERAAAHDAELPVGLDAAVDVDAAVAARLRPAGVADLVEDLAHDHSRPLRLREPSAGLRVDVDAQLVRTLRVAPPRRPRAELERREVRCPGDVRGLGDAQLVGVPAGRERHARRLDPLRPLLGHALLPDDLAADALGLPLQLARPLVQRAHDAVADRDEVVDEVELRLAARREVHLVRVRHLDGAAPELELDERRRHDRSIVKHMLEDPRPIRLTLEPLDDFVVIEQTDEEAETRGGLIIPASAETQCRSGIVTAVGGEADGISPGDKVLFPADGGYEVRLAGSAMRVIRRRELIARVHD